jgi:transketolase
MGPSWSPFEAQADSYLESVLPRGIKKRITVEAGSPMGWHRWVGDEGAVIGVERFGASRLARRFLLTWASRRITSRLLPLVRWAKR